jgi:RNA polymerase sigma-70 factor (ECF subfamily)
VTSDGELFARSLGAPTAFEEIFERHARPVWRYAQRRVGRDAADEVVAETFLIAFERRSRFDPSYGSARPWLMGIATNVIRHRLREERAHLVAMGRAAEPIEVEGSLDVGRLDAQRMRGPLTDALRSLSNEDRDTFLLVAAGELTYAEAAVALEIPVGTVRSRIHRARAQLRERVQGLGAIGDGGVDDDDG